MSKMSERQYNAIVSEYVRSKRNMARTMYPIWRTILSEYSLNSIGSLEQWLESNGHTDSVSLEALNGRVATMNVMPRKLLTLGTPKNTEFVISSQNHQNEAIAECLQHALAEVKDRIGWIGTNREIAMYAILMGKGIGKVGYSSQYVYGETAWTDSPLRDAGEYDIDPNMPYGPTTESQNFHVKDGWPNLIPVSPADIFFSPGARRMSEVRRIYHRYRRNLADAKLDVRYDRDARRALQGNGSRRTGDESMYLTDLWEDVADESSYVDIVECFDLSSRQYCVFNEGLNAPLRDWTVFGLPIDCPFKFLDPIPNPEFIWGVPPALVYLAQALSKNQLRMKLIDQINRDGKRVNFYDKNRMPNPSFPQEVADAADGQFIGVEGLADMQGEFFKTVDFGGASPEVLKLMNIIEGDLAEMSGLTDAARNSYTGGDQTATESSMRMQQQGLTTEEFLHICEEFQESCAADLCQVMLSEWQDDKLVKITGPTAESIFWVQLERARVLANFTIKIVAGSAERMDKSTLRRQWMEMLPQFMALADRATQDQQMQMQGYPPGPVNYIAMLEETVNQYNPTLARKIMNNRSSADLALRLMRNYGIAPLGMSPQLMQQVRAMAMQTMQGGAPPMPGIGAPGGGGQGGSPSGTSMPMLPGAPMYQNMGGAESGRTMSEAMRS